VRQRINGPPNAQLTAVDEPSPVSDLSPTSNHDTASHEPVIDQHTALLDSLFGGTSISSEAYRPGGSHYYGEDDEELLESLFGGTSISSRAYGPGGSHYYAQDEDEELESPSQEQSVEDDDAGRNQYVSVPGARCPCASGPVA